MQLVHIRKYLIEIPNIDHKCPWDSPHLGVEMALVSVEMAFNQR